MSTLPVEPGLTAPRDGEAAAARRALESARAESGTGIVLEGLGETAYLHCDYSTAAAHYERAFSVYRRAGDHAAAGRAARTAAWVTGNVLGDWAVRNGWLARARTVHEALGPDGPGRGWVLIIEAFQAPDPQVRERVLCDAISIGRQYDDPDITALGVGYLGSLYVMIDRVEEGLGLADEAMAMLCAGQLAELATVDELWCGLFWACEYLNDVPRADQWMRVAAERAERSNVVAAFCRAHYGGILTAAGRWNEAEAELLQALRHFDRGMPPRRAAAIIRLADLRVRQGRLEESTALLDGLDQHPDAVRTLAALYLARGETARARDLLERSTRRGDDEVPTVGESTMLGPLLGLLVEAYLADGRVRDADHAAGRLAGIAAAQSGLYLGAVAALAKGRVCIASGQGDARDCLDDALAGFARAQLPMELAETRLTLAQALAETSPEVSVATAKTALAEFERLSATRLADAAGAMLRSLGAPVRTGPKGVGTLTRREAEILQLVGAGLTNPEIANRLFIAPKTVEHHVGNMLTKLGLRNRAQAAAYVARASTSQ